MKIKASFLLIILLFHGLSSSAKNNESRIYIPKFEQLIQMTTTGDMEVFNFILDEIVYNQLKTVKLKLNDDYKTVKVGKLLTVSEKGLWMYSEEDELITYIPYTLVSKFQHNYSKYGFIGTSAAIGGIGFASGFGDIGGFPIGALLGGGFSALILPVYQELRASFSSFTFRFVNQRSGEQFYKERRYSTDVYGDYIDYIKFPKETNAKIPQNKVEIPKSNPPSTQTNVLSSNPTTSEANNPTKTESIVTNNSTSGKPAENKIVEKEAPISFINEKGKLNTDWMWMGFKSSEVDEKELLKKIPYIRSNIYESTQLDKLNLSELQFLCMILVTPNGYNFKNLGITFTNSQLKMLSDLESFSSQELKKGDAIATPNFALSDLQNLKTIYKLLND